MDILDLSRMFFGLLAVLAMIGLCAAAARKAGFAANGLGAGTRRRLQLVETIAVDARRRAVIIRCDDREHLVLLGPTSEAIIAADIPVRASAGEPLPQAFPISEALKLFKSGGERKEADAA